jgi:demethylmenaquinone methyltransferase/2-methoxy-6-polyprenyl-1,4-benzoquinol methylase
MTDSTTGADPAFAGDAATGRYYDQRAAEYDEWYLGRGLFAERDRPDWDADVTGLLHAIASLRPAHTLDIACGTGFLTARLRGSVIGIDQSPAMIAIAAARVPAGEFRVADALSLPFPDRSFDRVFTGHFYGHLPAPERAAFLAEARRVAGELVVVDSALRSGVAAEGWQERVLNDGSRHRVYKRYFTAGALAEEVSGEPFYVGQYFVGVCAALGAETT